MFAREETEDMISPLWKIAAEEAQLPIAFRDGTLRAFLVWVRCHGKR
jgi:hypothetical protein